MAQSPVEFAVAFEKLRSRIATSAGSDDAVLSLIEFWPRLEQLGRSPAYSSYIAEYSAFLEASLRNDGCGDLAIEELRHLESISLAIGVDAELVINIRKQIARLCFYVGELSEGLQACLRITDESFTLKSDLDLEANLSEIERFRILVDHLGDAAPDTKIILLRLLNDWQSEREFVSTSSIHSLLVQHSSAGDQPRGKLRVLTGSIEARSSHSANDEITFDNQLRAADDPIVGVAYHALAAIRSYFKATGYPKLGSQYYHAHLALAEREATYTGDSIGIATALLAYAQLLHTQALRHDHLLPGDIACTGGIDESGKVTAVNSDSLQAKVECVFFSHIKYLVLPAANLAQAQQYLDTMLAKYPSRHLILLPVASLSTIVNDHNIVRPEKLCIGEFVAKNAVKYSRMTKVQVPMLAVLAYLLLCVIYPKAWVGFDWNPARLMVEESRVIACNADNQFLWQHNFGTNLMPDNSSWCVGNLDDDSANEIVIVPLAKGLAAMNGWLFAFDDNGDTLFSRDCSIRRVYPGDTVSYGIPTSFETTHVYLGSYSGTKVIVTVIDDSVPGRGYIRFLDRNGKRLGWYINSGGSSLEMIKDLDGDHYEDFIFFGYNNRLACLSLFVLDPITSRGVSPPHWNRDLDLTEVEKGNAKYSIFFMPSEINQIYGQSDYQNPGKLTELADGSLNYELDEGKGFPTDWLPLEFRIENDFRITSVIPGDSYQKRLHALILEGRLHGHTEASFVDRIHSQIMYYIDGKLVSEGELPPFKR